MQQVKINLGIHKDTHIKKLSRKEIKKVTLLSNREIREVKGISNLTKQRISDFCKVLFIVGAKIERVNGFHYET